MPPTPPLSDVPPPLPWTYTPRRTRMAAYTVAVGVLVVLTVTGLVMQRFGPQIWGVGDTVGLIGTAVVIAAGALAVARPRLDCDERGCVVVNLVTTRALEWEEIVHVSFRPGDPWITLDLADGRTWPVMALQSSGKQHFRVGLAQFLALLGERTRTVRND